MKKVAIIFSLMVVALTINAQIDLRITNSECVKVNNLQYVLNTTVQNSGNIPANSYVQVFLLDTPMFTLYSVQQANEYILTDIILPGSDTIITQEFNIDITKLNPNFTYYIFVTISNPNESIIDDYNRNVHEIWVSNGMQYNTADISNIKLNTNIYPNPSHDYITTEFDYDYLQVYDITGKLIIQYSSTNKINISNLKDGMYVVKVIKDNKCVSTEKLIKK